MSNWFRKISQYVEPVPRTMEGVKKGPNKPDVPFEEGMKVRDRRKGMANPQSYGVVEDIKDNIMTIKWYGENGKKNHKEKYDLTNDLAEISFIVAEV